MSKPLPNATPRSARRSAAKRSGTTASGLGSPVGLTQGTFNQNEMKVEISSSALLTFCTCNYAYAYTYIQPPGRWCSKTINDIIVAGAALLRAAQNCNQRTTGAAEPLTEASVPRKIPIQTHTIELAPISSPELIGNLHLTSAVAPQQRSHNIEHGLRKFFAQPAQRRGCLFRCEPVQLLIWRRGRIYYVFDARGRNAECEQSANGGGVASLICLEALRNVVHLIVRMCGLRPSEFYTLSELRVVKVLPLPVNVVANAKTAPCADRQQQSPEDIDGYVVLNDHAAILHGSLTVGAECFTTTRNHQVLATCCVAYVYSLVRPPNSWTGRTVDKVLLFGNQMYADCVRYDLPEEFTIRNIPPLVTLGTFRAALRIMPFQHGGRLQHTIDPRGSELQLALRQFFDEHRCALLQIDQRTFAAWRRGEVYYLFDPYVRNAAGKIVEGSGAERGAACVHMHSTLESLCGLLYGNLMRIAEKEVFYVHGLWARVMDQRAGGDDAEAALQQVQGDNKQSADDVVSLNESIDSMFVPRLACKGVKVPPLSEQSTGDCNLDSPTVSATQFIRPWHVIKAEMFGRQGERDGASGSESDTSSMGSSSIADLSLDETEDNDEEEDDGPNNDLGLTNDEFDRLTEAGLNYDEIRDYLKLDLQPDEMIGWHKEGVSPDEVQRLRDIGIDQLKDFRQYRKWGLTLEDCERMQALGIPAKQYAKLKKQGVDPDDMLETIARKENLVKMRDQNLNQCHIDKLLKAGVTADEYEHATEKGLSFEEVLYATASGIAAEDFAHRKGAGMSNVDIVRARQLGLEPAEYMAMKERGMTDAEIARSVEQDELEELRKLGYDSDEARLKYNEMKNADPTMTPQKYDEFRKGITEADIARAKELDMDPDQYVDLKKMGMSEEGIEGVKAIEDKAVLKMLGYTSDETLEYANMKKADPTMTPQKYQQLKAEVAPVVVASVQPEAVDVQRPTQPPKVVHVVDGVRTPEVSAAIDPDVGKRGSKPDVQTSTVEDLRPKPVEDQRPKPVEDQRPKPAEVVRSRPSEDLRVKPGEDLLTKPTKDPLEIIGQRIPVDDQPVDDSDVSTGNVQLDADEDQPVPVPVTSFSTLPSSIANRITLETIDISQPSDRQVEGGSNESLYGSAEDRKEEAKQQLDIDAKVSSTFRTGPKQNMGVIKSAACTLVSFQKLFGNSFRVVDRVMVLNANNEPNCVAFRVTRGPPPRDQQYYLYEGCACNVQQIRRVDVNNAKDMLTAFPDLDRMIGRVIQRLRPDGEEEEAGRGHAIRTRSSPNQQQAVQYAKKLLDERLESISAKFNDLMGAFHTLTRDL